MQIHRWVLDSGGPYVPSDLTAKLEAERDHHLGTVLVAGKDPRDGTVLHHHGHERVIAHMNIGIKALVSALEGETRPVLATIRGALRVAEMPTVRNPTDDGDDAGKYHGQEITWSVTIARPPPKEIEDDPL